MTGLAWGGPWLLESVMGRANLIVLWFPIAPSRKQSQNKPSGTCLLISNWKMGKQYPAGNIKGTRVIDKATEGIFAITSQQLVWY